MSKAVLLLIAGGALLSALTVVEAVRWRVAGSRSTRVTLRDPSIDGVSIATDPEAFALLLQSQPSQVWAREVHANTLLSLGMNKGVAGADYDSARRAGRIRVLPNGTQAETIDSMEFVGGRFRSSGPGSLSEQNGEGRLEVVQIRVRKGPFKAVTGWTLPELMQHDVTWP